MQGVHLLLFKETTEPRELGSPQPGTVASFPLQPKRRTLPPRTRDNHYVLVCFVRLMCALRLGSEDEVAHSGGVQICYTLDSLNLVLAIC
jgi:hypothetical protein